jgi:hypothetical protein
MQGAGDRADIAEYLLGLDAAAIRGPELSARNDDEHAVASREVRQRGRHTAFTGPGGHGKQEDLALERRGWVELALTALPARRDDDLHERLEPLGDLLWQMFVDPDEGCEYLERRARLSGAVGALAVLALTYDTRTTAESARPLILTITWNALGHPGAFRSIPAS